MENRSILPRIWDVPQIFRDRLGDRAGRQRAMFADGHLLLVLHQVPNAEDNERKGRFLWRKPDGSWTSNDLGAGVGTLGKHLAQYAEAINQLEQREASATTATDYFSLLQDTAPLVRATAHLHQTLQEARKLVSEDRSLINYRDQSYDLERNADLLYSTAKNSLDFEIAKRSEEEARMSRKMAVSAHRLNVLAAFFFPLATLSAVFGVNLDHGLEGLAPAPVPLVVLVITGLLMGTFLALSIARPDRRDASRDR